MTQMMHSQFPASDSTDPTRLFIDTFFDTIKAECSPLLSVFSFDLIGPVVQTSKQVRRMISALGASLASNDSHVPGRMYDRQFTELYRQVQSEASTSKLHCPQGQDDNEHILSALLLGFLELITDASGLRWNSLYEGILRSHVWQRGPQGFSGTLEESLLNMYWICEGFRALSFDEDSRIIEWQNLKPQAPEYCHIRSPMPDRSLNLGDEACLAHCIAYLGSLNKRCLNWVYNSRRINPYSAHGTNESVSVMDCVGNEWLLHLLVGRGIVKEGFRVRDEISSLAPSLSAERNIRGECHVDFIMPFYHCGLVCISRFFIDPVWQFLGDELPLLSEEAIESHSLVALSYIEERLIEVAFESVFYLPLLMGISLEVRSLRHRYQITQLLQLIEKRGFAVARTCNSDIQLAWTLVPN